MRFESGRSREEFLADLTAEADRTWGPSRRAELQQYLDNAANALWRLAQAPLEALEAEPAFLAGSRPRDVEQEA